MFLSGRPCEEFISSNSILSASQQILKQGSQFFWQMHETELFHSSTVNDKQKHDETGRTDLCYLCEKNLTLAATEKDIQVLSLFERSTPHSQGYQCGIDD